MDSRDSSIDEARPLNPNGDRVDAKTASISPPRFEYSEHGRTRQLAFPLIAVLRHLVVIFTFANILIQLISEPRMGVEVFLVVWDFFILFGSLVALIVETYNGKQNNRLPSLGITLGDKTYYLMGGPPQHSYMFIPEQHSMPADRSRTFARVASFVVDLNLVVFLLTFSVISVTNGRYWAKYEMSDSIESVAILHFIVVAFMFILLLVRIISARTGSTVSLKLSLEEDEKSGLQLPDDDVPRGV
ncbi:hypothetical protein PFICI_10157 [Pestalotiopsis fici W106-1]|uniref:Uncharacterized protein n=1 Tax=Pestalotiopsis fici (strain W106-1 / CGMCC3.15140) TaxID=1229662 RepID=W3WW66_PESFW|nr:uncharacterized protein PFICI_10157 [Pestalotiopsis fici W106-1]ETS78095.1 hypothetical protein PFICI_10157 [Pestalotiopsis fici W106-1]